MIDFIPLFPELFLISNSVALLVFAVLALEPSKKKSLGPVALLTLGAFALTALVLQNTPIKVATFFFNSNIQDPLALFLKQFLLLSAFISLLSSLHFLKSQGTYAFENLILMALAVATLMILLGTYDLLGLYLALELQSLCFYVLAASARHSEFSTEAGLKYFLLGAFSSGILLFGFSLVYGFTGLTNFEDLAKLTADLQTLPLSLTVGIIFIAVAFLFKMTAVPFHMWAPDVYQGAPTYITAFFALVPKIALLGVFLRFFEFCLFFYDWETLFMISSLGSMLLGSLAALAQTNLKRLLAYSSISHVGFMLIGFCCSTLEGVQALLIYLVIYVTMSWGVFALALSLKKAQPLKGASFIESLHLFSRLAKTHKSLAFTFTLILFSMAGIPPLAGFCSKFYLFFAALSSSLYVLAVVGVLTSVVSCFYYIRFIKLMYFESAPLTSSFHHFAAIPFEGSIILAVVAGFLIFFGLEPSWLFLATHQTALALCF